MIDMTGKQKNPFKMHVFCLQCTVLNNKLLTIYSPFSFRFFRIGSQFELFPTHTHCNAANKEVNPCGCTTANIQMCSLEQTMKSEVPGFLHSTQTNFRLVCGPHKSSLWVSLIVTYISTWVTKEYCKHCGYSTLHKRLYVVILCESATVNKKYCLNLVELIKRSKRAKINTTQC